MAETLQELFARAMREGKQIDLAGCCYGEPHWRGEFVRTPSVYYHLLAGLVRSQRLTHVLELGTHYGGAIMAMSRGLHPANAEQARLVTVDVTRKNAEGFAAHPQIKRVTGDCFDTPVIEKMVASFDRPIDLLFIDIVHDYRQTYRSLALYANRLRPLYIVLDDIHLNASMERLWGDLRLQLGARAVDLSTLCERESAGLGALVPDRDRQWPEKYAHWKLLWRCRRVAAALWQRCSEVSKRSFAA